MFNHQLAEKKKYKNWVYVLLVLSLAFSFFIIIDDELTSEKKLLEQRKSQDSLLIQNTDLKNQIDSLVNIVKSGDIESNKRGVILESKITDLNDKLEPFVKIAYQKYPNKNLEEALGELQTELEETKKLAEPNKLKLYKTEITKIIEGYNLKVFLNTTKNERLGLIAIFATIVSKDTTRIIDIWPAKVSNFSSGPDSKLITSSGRQARLIYSLMGMGRIAIDIKVTDKCKIKIDGNNDLKSFEVFVK